MNSRGSHISLCSKEGSYSGSCCICAVFYWLNACTRNKLKSVRNFATSYKGDIRGQHSFFSWLPDNRFSFQPFICHIQCRSLTSAQQLHTCALDSGYRNTGVTVSNAGRITLAVRSTLALESPLMAANDENQMPPDSHLRLLLDTVGKKFEKNFERIDKFRENLELIDEL